MKKNLFRIAGVLIGISALLFFFTKLLTPTWFSWNTDNTIKGFYKEPENRIQVLFLGSSTVITGISPMILYDNYGICAYNMGTPEQPLMSSYYLLKEAASHHSETLKTVVLDSYFIFNQDPPFEKNERALTPMKFSRIKMEAFKELSDHYKDVNALNYLFPIFAYHSRWMQLSEDDFTGLTEEKNYYYTRGQFPNYSMAVKGLDPEKMDIPVYGISRESDYTPEIYQKVWGENNRIYFKKIVEFCKEHQLNLVLTALLYPGYWDLEHDALQYLAETNNIPFLDFNLVEMQEQSGLQFPYDYWNPTHPNILGAEKITNYIGNFLKNNCEIQDIRDNSEYDYLSSYSELYQKIKLAGELMSCDRLDRLLELLQNERYTVFISVKGDAASGLSDELRGQFSALGFRNLADIKDGVSYVGMKDHEQVIVDELGSDPQNIIIAQGKIDKKGGYSLTGITTRTKADGKFGIGNEDGHFAIVSAGSTSGDFSNIKIEGFERSENKNGLNIVVLDNDLPEFFTSSAFDTSSESCIRTDLEIPEIYKERLEEARKQAGK